MVSSGNNPARSIAKCERSVAGTSEPSIGVFFGQRGRVRQYPQPVGAIPSLLSPSRRRRSSVSDRLSALEVKHRERMLHRYRRATHDSESGAASVPVNVTSETHLNTDHP